MDSNQVAPQGLVIISIVIAIFLWFLFIGRYWLKALLSGVTITPTQLILMKIRGTPVALITDELIRSAKSGVVISRDQLEACYLSGGNVKNVVNGLVYAKKKGINFTIADAMKLDLDKRDTVIYLRGKSNYS